MNPLEFNMHGSFLTPAVLHMLCSTKPEKYRMHPTQAFAAWTCGMLIRDSIPGFRDITGDTWTKLEIQDKPCEIDPAFDSGTVEALDAEGNCIARIICVGVYHGSKWPDRDPLEMLK